MKRILFLLILCPFICLAKSIVVLPFSAPNLSPSEKEAVQTLFEQELEKSNQYQVLYSEKNAECSNPRQGAEQGEELGSDYVLFGKINNLGEKWIISYFLVNVKNQSVEKSDQASSEKIEELDLVIKRIVKSLSSDNSFEESAEFGNITSSEAKENNVRQSLSYGGLGFGYLTPTHGYDSDFDRSFTLDLRSYYEMEDFMVSGLAAIRKGFALNIGIAKMISRGDMSPFVGAGLGFHWVSHDDDFDFKEDDKRSDGLELLLSGGLMTFRTFNFRVILTLDYSYTFNDYDDQAITFTFSLMSKGAKHCGFF